MQKFKWKGADKQFELTNFREKILAGVGKEVVDFTADGKSIIQDKVDGCKRVTGGFDFNSKGVITNSTLKEVIYIPKFHTIREDEHNLWKAGRSIQMVYRGPNYSILDHFNKGIPELDKCVSVQKIRLWWTGALATTQNERDKNVGQQVKLNCIVDGRRLTDNELTNLAINDGFSSLDQFKKWFNKDFTGKIIHFTNLRY